MNRPMRFLKNVFNHIHLKQKYQDLAIFLVCGDLLGEYLIREKLSHQDLLIKLDDISQQLHMPRALFFHFLLMYYQSDASSYGFSSFQKSSSSPQKYLYSSTGYLKMSPPYDNALKELFLSFGDCVIIRHHAICIIWNKDSMACG